MKGKFFLKILQIYLSKKGNPEKIRNYISSKRITRSPNLNSIDPQNIRVAVVQEKVMIMKRHQEYVDVMYGFIQEAVGKGAQLISFPEENGTLVLGMLPFIESILKIRQVINRGGKAKNSEIDPANLRTSGNSEKAQDKKARISLVKLFSLITPFICNVFETTFSELAGSFGVYIMAGSVILEHNGRLVNRAYLFGPDGEIVGTQDKAHLVELEIDLGLATSDRLQVFATQIGKIAFPVCMDATYFETFKILKKQGAQIVIIPIANMEDYHYYLALRGIWPRVQESGVYGLKSSLVGDLYGIIFTGKAGIFAPIDLTPHKDGVIAEAATFNENELICQQIDLSLIDTYSSPYFSDENPELYKKYLSYIYELA